ncbi:MAG: GntR family transcriptional regulator [Ruminococcaceae bacterium]|jgi:DNA-binding GntR family transcriptional regulator|nr:GntR family transcriptional regulator [Oscillospiraceae bacterium]
MRDTSPADVAYTYIKNQIVTRAMYPGTKLVEEDIVRETGVSRTPVRSALMRLAYEGLVVQEPNRGAYVAKPTATDLRQVYETRAILEAGAFRLAVRRRSEESVRRMEENLRQQEQLEKLFNMSEYATLNREFHWLIAMEAQNAYLEKYLNELYNKVSTYLLFWDDSTTNDASLDIHRRIYEAFRDRDEEKGLAALMEDIQLAEDSLRQAQQL